MTCKLFVNTKATDWKKKLSKMLSFNGENAIYVENFDAIHYNPLEGRYSLFLNKTAKTLINRIVKFVESWESSPTSKLS